MDAKSARKLQAKRFNEHIKLFVTTVNAIGLVTFGAGVLQPLIARTPDITVNWYWVALAAILHLWAQAVIRLVRPE